MRGRIPDLPPELAGERFISLVEVAGLRNCSVDSIKRDPKLASKIVRLSTRRVGMKLKYALDLAAQPAE
jgi:hypothetical protein